METISETLGAVRLFADALSPPQLDQLAGKCHIADYEAGAVLFTEGDFGTFMVAIVSGRLDVTVAGTRHPTREVAILGPGEIVGEMSLMTGARRSATDHQGRARIGLRPLARPARPDERRAGGAPRRTREDLR